MPEVVIFAAMAVAAALAVYNALRTAEYRTKYTTMVYILRAMGGYILEHGLMLQDEELYARAMIELERERNTREG